MACADFLDRDRCGGCIGSRPDPGGVERRTPLPRSSRVQRGPPADRPGSFDGGCDPDHRPGRGSAGPRTVVSARIIVVGRPPCRICADSRFAGRSQCDANRFLPGGSRRLLVRGRGHSIPVLPRSAAHRAVLVRRVTVLCVGVLVPRLCLGRHRAGALCLRPDSGLAPECGRCILDCLVRAGRVDRSGSFDLDAWPCTVH